MWFDSKQTAAFPMFVAPGIKCNYLYLPSIYHIDTGKQMRTTTLPPQKNTKNDEEKNWLKTLAVKSLEHRDWQLSEAVMHAMCTDRSGNGKFCIRRVHITTHLKNGSVRTWKGYTNDEHEKNSEVASKRMENDETHA